LRGLPRSTLSRFHPGEKLPSNSSSLTQVIAFEYILISTASAVPFSSRSRVNSRPAWGLGTASWLNGSGFCAEVTGVPGAEAVGVALELGLGVELADRAVRGV